MINKLYAVRNKRTGKLVSNLSGKNRTFYQRKGMIESLLEIYCFHGKEDLNNYEIVIYNLNEESCYQINTIE